MRRWHALGLFLGLILLASPVLAQGKDDAIPHAQDRPPGPALSPEEAVRKMTVPPGFSVEIVASEPDIVNPVAMTFDERGRVWITESLEYPRKSAGPGRDRIKILEDTDGDGKADKFTVFADGLNIPSGIAVGAGGVWVANAPDILFLQDTDGDGKADTREVIVTGFGRYDTHELPNSLTWGPDGYLYGWNGVFNPAKIDYRGKRFEFTCAVFRINPRTRDFEVFCEGTSNPWGITWDKNGEAFASACVIDHLWHLTETGYYHRQGGAYPPFTWRLESIVDHQHQKAAYCGINYFDSEAYPEKYRERLFMGNIHGSGINLDRLEPQGATYRGKTESDFLSANDSWFMPVVQKTGPDGSLYILDWYDRYHCYQDANRDPSGIDRLKGRLYRVRYKETARAPKFDLALETDAQLVERLASPNLYFREIAQQVLRERDNPATRPRLMALVLDPSAARKTRLHALWTLVGTGRLDLDFHLQILGHDDPTFRAWGVRAAGNFRRVDALIREKVVGLTSDPRPEVRVQVAIACRKIEGIDPLPVLVSLMSNAAGDPLLTPIVWQNLHPLLDHRGLEFVDLLGRRDQAIPGAIAGLIPRFVERLLGGSPAQPEAAVALFNALLKTPEATEPIRNSLVVMTEKLQGGALPRDRRDILRNLLKATITRVAQGQPLSLDMAFLAATWGDPNSLKAIRQAIKTTDLAEPTRLQALKSLVEMADGSLLQVVGDTLDDPKAGSTRFRGEMIAALGRLDDPKVADILLDRYPGLEPELQPKVVELLTQRATWTRPLLDAIARKAIPAAALNVNQVRKLAVSKDPAIVDRIKSTWGTVRESRNPSREKVIDEMRGALKQAKGDPIAGAQVFRNVCAQCHKIYGEGQEVGPEVTLNGRGSYEQLLSNVFDPSLVIGTAYQATTVATSDGRVLTGLVVEDSPQRLVLKLQGGKVETLPRAIIEETKISALSLMPEGIEGQLKARELADLFAFLSLDKPPADSNARPIPGTPPGIRK